MNSNLAASSVKEDPNFDMMKYGPSPISAPSDIIFNSLWNTCGGFPEMTYAPGEYLNNKGESYDCYTDSQNVGGNEFVEWSSNTSSILNSPITGAPSEASYNDFLSPTALGNTPPWHTDSFDQRTSFAAADDTVPSSAASGRASMQQPMSPIASKTKVSKRKAKSLSKSLSRTDTKSKSISSASSSSSSSSIASNRCSNSGHGGNHNITLRTASRKPKLSTRPEDNGCNSRDSSPCSPDGGGDSLTSEERRARQNHNVVEKQYRNRLNIQFERLLAILPANQTDSDGASRHGEFDDRRMSKAEVLDMARRRIHSLEQERKQLHAEREALLENVNIMQHASQRRRLGMMGNAS
ncbi:helix-loop-helix DNA-binding domain containing protein [Grosmannia clavigera kw1407]|uniref:Helix-loop-helix DNA-binding domain containing protein n=1 Tax=Grosmannia clavigera (strain kw1407 / UAMH 11150) TaxID=655863 RepID=F0XJH3_GROCL|nr:helix-loop-helix DNA-binding domain containing protein [Grosmannia clavigera kw1407]EFX02316.1 helix-loop-helix DNA-binding domain containing protein [Grosmannia clavigera kw1407]